MLKLAFELCAPLASTLTDLVLDCVLWSRPHRICPAMGSRCSSFGPAGMQTQESRTSWWRAGPFRRDADWALDEFIDSRYKAIWSLDGP